MRLFSGQNELIQFARKVLLERIRSLKNDVKRCISDVNVPFQTAPFPALLYCFSVMDFLGALLAGDASRNAPTAEQAREYMQRFMNYTEEQAKLVQGIFRHKLVHLAQPKPIMESTSMRISWQEWHDNCEKHLVLERLREEQNIRVTSVLSITYTHIFHLGIWNLVEDIKLSLEKPNGYLHSLETSVDLQDKFEKAISQLYDYK